MSWPMVKPPVRPAQAHYHNKGTEPIKLSIGLGGPGVAWTCYDAAPGEVVQGPLGYADKFAAGGFTMISGDEAEKVKAEAESFAQLEAEERAAKEKAETEAKTKQAEAEAATGEAQKALDRKGRRADRSSTG